LQTTRKRIIALVQDGISLLDKELESEKILRYPYSWNFQMLGGSSNIEELCRRILPGVD
jgi:hypothetical protein